MTYVELIQERRAEALIGHNRISELNALVLEVLRQYEALLASITCKCGHTTDQHYDGMPIYGQHCEHCNCIQWEQ